MLDDSDVGQQAPKTPKRDETFQQNVNAVTSTNLELYEHKDEQIQPCFADSELDGLEEYDMNFTTMNGWTWMRWMIKRQ